MRDVPDQRRDVVSAFFASHIRTLCTTVTERLLSEDDPELNDQIVLKTATCEMLEVMYSRLPASQLHGPGTGEVMCLFLLHGCDSYHVDLIDERNKHFLGVWYS